MQNYNVITDNYNYCIKYIYIYISTGFPYLLSVGGIKMISEYTLQERVNSLDLDPIKVKLMDSKEGLGWSLEQVTTVEGEYRKFLYLSTKYTDRPIVPSSLIDKFWHYHILDTPKYAQDCREAFGFFLHHFPYFGLRGEEDAQNLQHAFQQTLELYSKEFGVDQRSYTGEKSADCSRACSPQACVPGGCNPSPENNDIVKPQLRPTMSPSP